MAQLLQTFEEILQPHVYVGEETVISYLSKLTLEKMFEYQ